MVNLQEFRAFQKIPRLSRECTISEKIDGTCGLVHIEEVTEAHDMDEVTEKSLVSVVTGDKVFVFRAGSKGRWIYPGKQTDNYGFAEWVKTNAVELVKLGPGYHYGEWWGQGIQRNYGLAEKRFSLFNTSKWSDDAVRPACCSVVPVLFHGDFDYDNIANILDCLAFSGSVAAPGFKNPEGIIIFHEAARTYFKKTILHDEKPKAQVEAEAVKAAE